jgi:hypothetical protein
MERIVPTLADLRKAYSRVNIGESVMVATRQAEAYSEFLNLINQPVSFVEFARANQRIESAIQSIQP